LTNALRSPMSVHTDRQFSWRRRRWTNKWPDHMIEFLNGERRRAGILNDEIALESFSAL
jgi:hypothetical protein